ncbi:BrnA antitoxin family protein [Breznakiella homolactica]|uniref:BrnA antitoxin family protein n=1 Tax=Breznakiella homolactica TaxID=2798577 RepID=A0A7T7XLV7_9SPIR|nr:BrnA antitoxin family protein [Breznakiella homolactica]QQO08790.1 BrnA antitoxin family protein [Breznakiella homolactica]
MPDSADSYKKELARIRELARRQEKNVVSVRVSPDALEVWKSLGRGYTGIMAALLEYTALRKPEWITQALDREK